MARLIIIDSHLDLAWNAITWKRDLLLNLAEMNQQDAQFTDRMGRGRATITIPEMKRGQVAACLGTMMGRVPYGSTQVHSGDLDFPSHENCYAFAYGQLGYYRHLHDTGHIKLISTARELRSHIELWIDDTNNIDSLPVGIVIAMEGSDAIVEPGHVTHWFENGLRVASLVHYGSSKYASGTGDDGPLTHAGIEILHQFERCGMILDVTHLCDQSFLDAVKHFDGPMLASHQNCRTLVPGVRQFSDQQIKILLERGGVIGTAMDAWMLFPGWKRGSLEKAGSDRSCVDLTAVADQIDHVCQLAGNSKHSAIGSDLDGGFGTEQTPSGLDSIADLQKLGAILMDRGYSEDDVDSIFYKNWQRFFEQHLPD